MYVFYEIMSYMYCCIFRAIQEATGLIALIEKTEFRRYKTDKQTAVDNFG